MSLTTEQSSELRDVQMAAADAQRLLNDPTLWAVFRYIRGQALHATVYSQEERDRAQSRQLVVAIDLLATELQTRIETALNVAEAQRHARAFE